jgi:hypothetical protein
MQQHALQLQQAPEALILAEINTMKGCLPVQIFFFKTHIYLRIWTWDLDHFEDSGISRLTKQEMWKPSAITHPQ